MGTCIVLPTKSVQTVMLLIYILGTPSSNPGNDTDCP